MACDTQDTNNAVTFHCLRAKDGSVSSGKLKRLVKLTKGLQVHVFGGSPPMRSYGLEKQEV